ncbi:MAG: V-type ATPase subunit [Candidatus Hydrogenedentes bacterium]|nr:V-type ATPase subunit [Candidatus Hydrogenedentota bacterium]
MGEIDTFAAYYNARVKAMKSELLPQSQVEELLDRDDLDFMTSQLLTSPYKVDMAESLTLYSGTDAIEDAVSRNMVKTFQKLLGIAQGEFKELVNTFLARWDLVAVKALLRNRHHGLDLETGRHSLVPGPKMSMALVSSFAAKDSMEDLVAALASWNGELCGCLRGQLAAYRDTRSIAVLETALDNAYFVGNVRKLGQSDDPDRQFLRKALQMEIDRINLRTLFQLREAEVSTEEILSRMLPMGTLPPRLLKDMGDAGAPERAIELLGPTMYARLVEGMYSYMQTGRFSPFERMFERLVMGWLIRHARAQAFGVSVLMTYAWLKYNEVMNLRMIALGEARHLPRGRVREEIFYA